jgi:hypothetical protein
MFYTPINMNTFCNQRHVPPLVFAETQQSDNFTPSLQGFDFGPAVLGVTTISFASADPHPDSQYVNQWSFSLQKALPSNVVVEVGYQGTRGFHLQRAHLINNAQPGAGPIGPRRPYPRLAFCRARCFRRFPGTVPHSRIRYEQLETRPGAGTTRAAMSAAVQSRTDIQLSTFEEPLTRRIFARHG